MWDLKIRETGSEDREYNPEGVNTPHFSTLPAPLKTAINLAHYKGSLCPRKEDIFQAFYQFKPEQTKVIIVGPEPHPNSYTATGLAFGYRKAPVGPISSTYRNILTEVKDSVGQMAVPDPTLKVWAKQGVLLLNTRLTTEHLKSNSHQNLGWEQVVTDYLKELDQLVRYKVYIGWGEEAHALLETVNKNQNLVLLGPHPSNTDMFLGCDHFAEANDFLERRGRGGIVW
jgi:uracil-DNA glycosylase